MPTAALRQAQAGLPSRPGAERMQPLLAALGNPHRAFPVVHVGGTNGKGSVCAMLTSILRSAGFKVARYTSPHLVAPTERIWYDGADIPARELEARLAEIRSVARILGERGEWRGPYSEFDLLTAAAFCWFAAHRPDIAVVEAGLGGRTDATNVVEAPVLSILTNVSLDHTEILGADEEAIAREKAAIIKESRPAVTQAAGKAYPILAAAARERRATLRQVTGASFVSAIRTGQRIGYKGKIWNLGLLGTYQLLNAGLVLEAVGMLRQEGFAISDEAVAEGLEGVSWPGRFEPWDGWLFDGAHNLAGAAELAASWRRHFPGEEAVLVAGVLRSKPGPQMLHLLAPLASTVILTSVPSERTLAPDELGAGLRHDDLRIIPDPGAAIREAARIAGSRRVVVCGSLYLVGFARMLALGLAAPGQS